MYHTHSCIFLKTKYCDCGPKTPVDQIMSLQPKKRNINMIKDAVRPHREGQPAVIVASSANHLTPVAIQMLIDYHTGVWANIESYTGTKTYDNVHLFLHQRGLIEKKNKNVISTEWQISERGTVFISMLLKTGLPVQRWVDPYPESDKVL